MKIAKISQRLLSGLVCVLNGRALKLKTAVVLEAAASETALANEVALGSLMVVREHRQLLAAGDSELDSVLNRLVLNLAHQLGCGVRSTSGQGEKL